MTLSGYGSVQPCLHTPICPVVQPSRSGLQTWQAGLMLQEHGRGEAYLHAGRGALSSTCCTRRDMRALPGRGSQHRPLQMEQVPMVAFMPPCPHPPRLCPLQRMKTLCCSTPMCASFPAPTPCKAAALNACRQQACLAPVTVTEAPLFCTSNMCYSCCCVNTVAAG